MNSEVCGAETILGLFSPPTAGQLLPNLLLSSSSESDSPLNLHRLTMSFNPSPRTFFSSNRNIETSQSAQQQQQQQLSQNHFEQQEHFSIRNSVNSSVVMTSTTETVTETTTTNCLAPVSNSLGQYSRFVDSRTSFSGGYGTVNCSNNSVDDNGADLRQNVEKIKSHPLFPLLALIFENVNLPHALHEMKIPTVPSMFVRLIHFKKILAYLQTRWLLQIDQCLPPNRN
ncbi:unnamed protein product [Heterobilharzia americana]|nr:unnamed protein product [Heterobilharzia americana]